MPYFRERVIRDGFQTVGNLANGSLESGYVVKSASDMMTFRTNRKTFPGISSVTDVPLNVAEPYSYFETLEKLKEDNLKVRSPTMASGLTPDTGHTWSLKTYEFSGPATNWLTNDGSRNWVCQTAPLPAINGSNSWWSEPLEHDLGQEGANLFGRAVPSTGMFNLGQFLGELREGLPSILPKARSATKQYREFGSQHLNIEFGWKPLLNDLQNLAKAFMAAQSALTGEPQVTRRTRKGISDSNSSRNEFTTPPGIYSSIVPRNFRDLVPAGSIEYGGNPLPSYYYGTTGPTSITTTSEYSIRFVGQFYVLPKLTYSPDAYLERVGALMDTNITPSVLWELAPWSWMADWFLNIGTMLNSYEGAVNSRILAQYAYVMEDSTTIVKVHTPRANANYGFLSNPVYPGGDSFFVSRSRRRVRANPFGYIGITGKPLSQEQLGILQALSLTKV